MAIAAIFDGETLQVTSPRSSEDNHIVFCHTNPKRSPAPPQPRINPGGGVHHDPRLYSTDRDLDLETDEIDILVEALGDSFNALA